jgi:hypothetical protein|tara:strand:- start:10512 stop:10724 length:213 start_codon:yes stop_codon:yes gene_type:complete
MSSCVETFSLTQLRDRKIFLENQLNIVNDLIENFEKNNSKNDNDNKNDEIINVPENKKVTIKIKLKPKDK